MIAQHKLTLTLLALQEILDIASSYQRLERIVTAHLHGLQRALETRPGKASGNFV